MLEAGSSLSFIDSEAPRVVVFCGKGGVGKTTCAAATAFHTSRAGLRTLLLSADPTPSPSDIFETEVRRELREVAANLYAVELNYGSVVEMWKRRVWTRGPRGRFIVPSCQRGDNRLHSWRAGHRRGVRPQLSLRGPRGRRRDSVGTAPAGGTLSLIKLQHELYEHLSEAAKLYVRVRKALEVLTRGFKRDPISLIESWRELAARTLTMLRDEKTNAIVVTIAEALGVRITEDGLGTRVIWRECQSVIL